MPNRPYRRRPQLAGKTLKLSSSAVLRGNLRRHAPDGTSTVPYFPSVTAGMTLIVQTQAGTATANLAGPSFSGILTTLNTALGPINAKAFDDGGCIGLSTTSSGGNDYIQVNGGTAAALLGFPILFQRFRAKIGEVTSTPEGQRGQPFGAALPNIGDDVTTEVISRAVSQVMANTDFLRDDTLKDVMVVRKIGTAAGPTSRIGVSAVAGGDQRIFTGWASAAADQALAAGSTKEEIAPFFFLVDNTTKELTRHWVTGLTDAAGVLNYLGAHGEILAATAITTISQGRVVEVATANLTTAQVKPGDFVNITGATNAGKSNNGFRWIVEEVLDTTHLVLRHMSQSELTIAGTTVDDEQYQAELNDYIGGGESYGSIAIQRGPWVLNPYLAVSPALISGETVEVWAAVPVASSQRRTWDSASASLKPLINEKMRELNSYPLVPNGVLTRPTLTPAGGTLVVGAFDVRWRGRVIHVPPYTANPGADGTYFVFWDEDTLQPDYTNSGANVFPFDARTPGAVENTNKGLLLGVLTVSGGATAASVAPAAKLSAEDVVGTITVGAGSQFTTFEDAYTYLYQWFAYYGTGPWPQAEVLITSDITLTTASFAGNFPLSIRGVNADVTITPVNPAAAPFAWASSILQISDIAVLGEVVATGPDVTLRNVRYGSPLNKRWNHFQTSGTRIRHDSGGARTYFDDATGGSVALGIDSNSVEISQAGHATAVKGTLGVDQTATFSGVVYANAGLGAPLDRIIRVGNDNPNLNKAVLSAPTGGVAQGTLTLGKDGEADVSLKKDDLDLLVGGPASNASSLHTHPVAAGNVSVVPAGTIGSTNAQAALQELDGDIQGHINATGGVHGATVISMPSAIIMRDVNGRASVGAPIADSEIDTQGARNTAISTAISGISPAVDTCTSINGAFTGYGASIMVSKLYGRVWFNPSGGLTPYIGAGSIASIAVDMTGGDILFVIPAGFRPAANWYTTIVWRGPSTTSEPQLAMLMIGSNGNVRIRTGGSIPLTVSGPAGDQIFLSSVPDWSA